MSSIIPLFPSAVMVCSAKHTLSAGEEEYIRNVEYGDNSGNLKSSSDRILEQPELAAMQAFVQKQIKSYTQSLLKLDSSIDLYISQSWLNKAEKDQYHPQHNHPNSVLSGVLFLSGGGKLPPIRFHRLQRNYYRPEHIYGALDCELSVVPSLGRQHAVVRI